MLSISGILKEILKHDYLPYRAPVEKSLVLYFEDLDLTITENDISDNFEWDRSLTTNNDELTIGDCNSDTLKFQAEGITDDLIGQKFTAKLIISNTEIKLGTFIVTESPREDALNVKAVTAFDYMSKFDTDVSSWYNGLDWSNTTYTLKSFRNALCVYCGVQYEDSSLPNDDMIVSKTISTNQLKGRDVLMRCEELNGCFGHINRDGKLDHVVLAQSNPVDSIDNTAYDSLVFEEYTTDPISKIQIKQEDGDVGAYYGTGDNCYTITGNFLVYGKSAAELAVITQNAASNIIGITYRPYEYSGQGLPYQDLGDYVTLSGNETANSYIMHSIMTGTQVLGSITSAKGSKKLTEDMSLNIQVIQLQGKSNVLKRDVEGLSSTVTNITTNVAEVTGLCPSDFLYPSDELIMKPSVVSLLQSTIEQTAESITLEVTRATQAEGELTSQIELTAESITSEVTRAQTVEGTLSSRITQNASSITSEVTRAKNAEGTLSSRITQNATNIELKVSKNGVVSSINQSSESIKISASKLELTGYITATNLSTSGQTIINGGNITTGTIDASIVTVTNLSATNIKTGTLDCNNITVSNLSANSITSGTLNCNNITVTNLSANSITTGTLDCSKITVNNLSASRITSGTLDCSKVTVTNLNASQIFSNGIEIYYLRSNGYRVMYTGNTNMLTMGGTGLNDIKYINIAGTQCYINSDNVKVGGSASGRVGFFNNSGNARQSVSKCSTSSGVSVSTVAGVLNNLLTALNSYGLISSS